MAPGISRLSSSEEAAVLNSLLKLHPSLRVDMLVASSAVKEGENFMSIATKVEVTCHDAASGEAKDICLFMKSLPKSTERCSTFHCDAAFANEAAFYSRVLPTMIQQSSAKLAFPPCLHAADDLVILRHLGQDGYVMADRRQGLDLQHCQLVLKELGKYHAVSFAMKHNNPEEFDGIKSAAREFFITKDNAIFNATVDNCIEMILLAVPNMKSSTAEKLNGIRGKGFDVLSPLIVPSEPLAVITHGDLWSNNLLFRYSSEDTHTPSEVCFLDLQGYRYASPALDILYFLFSSSRPGVVKQHFRQLIETYHHSLVDHLDMMTPLAPAVDLEDIFDDIKHRGVFGFLLSTMVLSVITADEFTINLDDINENSFRSKEFIKEAEKGLLTNEFKRRVNENLEVFLMEGLF